MYARMQGPAPSSDTQYAVSALTTEHPSQQCVLSQPGPLAHHDSPLIWVAIRYIIVAHASIAKALVWQAAGLPSLLGKGSAVQPVVQ